MRKTLILLPVLLLANLVFAQKTINDPNAEKREVGSFTGVTVSSGIDLILMEGNEAVAVTAADPKHRDRIKTEVKNGVLKIWYDWEEKNVRMDFGTKKMKAYVSYRTLNLLGGSGGSDIDVDGTIKSAKLKLDISGGSDFEGSVDVGSLDVDQSGGSDVKISGKVSNLVISASGGSDFNGYGLVAENANIDASGGSDVTITVNKEIKADASGGSDIHFKGNASLPTTKSNGSTIKKVSK